VLPFVVNDLVIQEDSCNLACEYCLTGQSLFKEDHSLQKIFDPPQPLSCLPGTELYERLSKVVASVSLLELPVVKISGGEVLLIRGIMEFVERLSECYETVVILTNGVPLTEPRLERLLELGNVVLQLSLDSTRYRGNSYRVQSQAIHDALMKRLRRALASGLAVEVYLVLNDRSIEDLEATCEDLAPYGGAVTVFPFPVRGPQRERFLPRPEQHALLFRCLDRAADFGDLLPLPPYLMRLRRFFAEEGRTFRCHLPRIAFTTFDDGAVTSCPNIWFNHVGNLLRDDPAELLVQLDDSPFRKLLLADRPRIDACKACFTPWDPISLYFEGELSLDEVAQVPIYRGSRTRERLRRIRDGYVRMQEADAQHRSPHAG
jgi:MoaA/NifB/PqqE/SkfB family radical SAM enzyme